VSAVPWVESHSLSFSARHEEEHTDEAQAVLDALEVFRAELEGRFERTPYEVAVVIHPRPLMLAFAHPWLPIARMIAAPASRRYFAGWFGEREIHVLAAPALERRASNVEGSLEALLLTPLHEYTHVVIGANNPDLPPPFTLGSFRCYTRWAWLCEGAATHFSGQTPHLRAAIVRRLREGGRPEFPPSAADAQLLGGTIYALLEQQAGRRSAVELAASRDSEGPRRALEAVFERPLSSVERDWRDYLDSLRAS
jgi:hypothetical protein